MTDLVLADRASEWGGADCVRFRSTGSSGKPLCPTFQADE